MKEKHNKSNDLSDPENLYLLTVFYSEFSDYIATKSVKRKMVIEVNILDCMDKVQLSLN